MAAKLVFAQQGRRGERVLEGDSVTLGRDPGNDIMLEDASISRFHARFDYDGHRWRITDTRSTNRVRVNGELLEPEAKGTRTLSDGDAIVLGIFEMRFVREETEQLVLGEEGRPGTRHTTAVSRLQDLSGLIGTVSRLPREAEEAVERARRVVAVLATLGQRIAAVTPIDDIINAIVDLVFETTPAERAALFLWDPELGRLVAKRTGAREAVEAAPLRVSESLVQRAFAEKVAVQMDPKVSLSESMHDLRLRSAIALQLLDESKAVGVIYADTSQHAGAFDAFSVSLLSALANHGAIALEQARLIRRVRQEERSRLKLEQYLARPVVDRILASGESSPGFMRADEAEVTVLFCDMAGFTARTEGLPPHGVLILLNRYFSAMTEVIFEHEGTLDKYIGDCIMAVFGAPCAQPDHARRAAWAALGMRDAIRRMNEGQPEEARVEFRIGMHSGKVVAGDIGHVARRDWTVLGSTVNLASRMESAVAQRDQIVLTGDTLAGIGAEFEVKRLPVDTLPRGISRSFEAFELVGARAWRG
jgi:adenylate cyclase